MLMRLYDKDGACFANRHVEDDVDPADRRAIENDWRKIADKANWPLSSVWDSQVHLYVRIPKVLAHYKFYGDSRRREQDHIGDIIIYDIF